MVKMPYTFKRDCPVCGIVWQSVNVAMDGRASLVLCYVLTFLGSLGFPSHSLSITNDGESVSIISELKWYAFCSYPSKVRLPSYGRPRAKAFFGRRVLYCNNSTATTQFELLKLSGDISSNPGPEKGDASNHSKSICGGCSKTLRRNQDGVRCAGLCGKTFHVKCSGASFKELRTRDVQAWYCSKCSLPPLSDSFFDDSDTEGDIDQVQVEGGTEAENEIWADFDQKANNHRSNLKLGHINANSIGGFKFNEIKTWLQSGRLDVLIISETKIDATFPNSMFHVEGFRLSRRDRKAGGGGLMVFVRSDICFIRVKELKGLSSDTWSTFKTESIVLKVKLPRTWITVVGIYRPPSIVRSQWTRELSVLFEAVSSLTNTVFLAGDLNADLLAPDKQHRDGRALLDLLDIFNLDCLITEPTRTTKTTETLLDLILTNDKKKV